LNDPAYSGNGEDYVNTRGKKTPGRQRSKSKNSEKEGEWCFPLFACTDGRAEKTKGVGGWIKAN
jgi:hypothetical protein